MPKYVMLPPIDDDIRAWARRIEEALPELEVVIAEDEATAERELVDADAAYGGVSADVLPNVERLRLLQNPFAGPPPGYYYEELAEHPVIVSNPRGIYSDHISQHIMMFMLALARGLPYWSAAQAEGRWDTKARKRGYVNLADSTVLINGIGGIGAETARVCAAFGARVIARRPTSCARRALRGRRAERTRQPPAGGGLRRDHRAAHAGDGGDVERRALRFDEELGVLHQHRARDDCEPR